LDEPRPTGLKPTLRQLMIFVLWAALVTAAAWEALRWNLFGDRPEIVFMTAPVYLGAVPPPLLAVLFWMLDRPGRVRSWYCSMCMAAGSGLMGSFFLLEDLACYVWSGKPTLSFPFNPLFGIACLFGAWKQWQLARPGICPKCGRRSVIIIAQPLYPGSLRLVNLGKRGWCASCGG
jgi:hypothetical protein